MRTSTSPRVGLRTAAVIVAGIFAAACSTETTAPLRPASTYSVYNSGGRQGEMQACKVSGPAGTYSFKIAVVGGGDYSLPSGAEWSVNFDGTNPACALVYMPVMNATWTEGLTAQVTVSEINLPAGMTVLAIQIFDLDLGNLPTVTNSNSATVTVNASSMVKFKFFNSDAPPPPSGRGCTPGYWKQSQHLDSWIPSGLQPTQTIGSVFANASLYSLGNHTLLQGLSFKGGSSLTEAAQILLRASIASMLNAGHTEVGAPLTASQIVSAVNTALASGSREDMLSIASRLDDNNNLGCTLN